MAWAVLVAVLAALATVFAQDCSTIFPLNPVTVGNSFSVPHTGSGFTLNSGCPSCGLSFDVTGINAPEVGFGYFTSFDLGSEDAYLIMRDEFGREITYTGRNRPSNATFSSLTVYVNTVGVTPPGFKAFYAKTTPAICGNNSVAQVSGLQGTVSSTNPAAGRFVHPAYLSCAWNVSTGNSAYNSITWILDSNVQVYYPYGAVVEIYDGLTTSAPVYEWASYSSYNIYRTGPNAYVTYYSGTCIGYEQLYGFRAYWKASHVCSGQASITAGTDIIPFSEPGPMLARVCSWVVTAPSGQVAGARLVPGPTYGSIYLNDGNLAVQFQFYGGSSTAAPLLYDSADPQALHTTSSAYVYEGPITSNTNVLLVVITFTDMDQSYVMDFSLETFAAPQPYCLPYPNLVMNAMTSGTISMTTPFNDSAVLYYPTSCTWDIVAPVSYYGYAMNITYIGPYSTTHGQAGFILYLPNDTTISPPGANFLYSNNAYGHTFETGPWATLGLNGRYFGYMPGIDFLLTFQALTPVQCSASSVVPRGAAFSNPTPMNYNTRTNNMASCVWLTQVAGGQNAVYLYFYEVNIEYSAGCTKDSVRVYDGNNVTAPMLANLCGMATAFVSSTSTVIATKYTSDAAVQSPGFNVVQHCNGTVYVGFDGSLSGSFSPTINFGEGPYYYGIHCTWVIHVSPQYVIDLVLEADLASSDKVYAYDGDSLDYNYGCYSGTSAYQSPYAFYTSSRNVVTVDFEPCTDPAYSETNIANLYTGFNMTWSARQVVVSDNYGNRAINMRAGYNAFYVQLPYFYNGTNLASNALQCVQLTTGSPSTNQNMFIMLDMNMRGNATLKNYQNGGVQIPTAFWSGRGPQMPVVRQDPDNYYSYLYSTPDADLPEGGFLMLVIRYNPTNPSCDAINVQSITTPDTFNVLLPKSNYGTVPYGPSLYCFQTLTVSTGQARATFSAMDIQPSTNCVVDALMIYDGPNNSMPLIGVYCGSVAPSPIVASGRSLLFVFRSDGFMNTYKGYRATIDSTTATPTTGASSTSPPTTAPPTTATTLVATQTSTANPTSATSAGSATATATDTTASGTGATATMTGSGSMSSGDSTTSTGNDAVVVGGGADSGGASGAIIGGAVGGFVVLLLVVVLIVLLLRRRSAKRKAEEEDAITVQMGLAEPTVRASFQESGMRARVEAMMKASSTKQIGTGGTAKVYRAELDGKMVALKVLSEKSPEASKEFHREANILGRMTGKENKNVLQLVFFCDNPPTLVCELAEQGSLARMRPDFKNFEPARQKNLLLQVAEGMEFLHDNDIVHMDLKPDNVLIAAGDVCKVSDFGSSAILGVDIDMSQDGLSSVKDFNGTPQYASPERFRAGMRIDLKKADVYSYGVMAWSLMAGAQPYAGETGPTIMSQYTSMKGAISALPLDMAVLTNRDTVYVAVVKESLESDFKIRPHFRDLAGMLRTDSADRTRMSTMSSMQSMRSSHVYETVRSEPHASGQSSGVNMFPTDQSGMGTRF